MSQRKLTFENVLLAVVLLLAVGLIIWLLAGCAVLTQRTAKVTYTKGCAITVEGMEVQKAAETARQISMTDCTVNSDTEASGNNSGDESWP